MTECVESALVELFTAARPPASGVALTCVGSMARRELGPRSDLDLVLVHSGTNPVEVNALAERLWYPLWDAKLRLDHSVRTPAECTAVAGQEVSAGVGLLDLRYLAGDQALVGTARSDVITAWRSNARKRLPELLTSLEERLETFGDAAHLLEPDLKESRGGFRDASMLHALAATWLTDRPHAGVDEPYQRLLDVRDALHLSSGRNLDRLSAAEVPDVARRLGFATDDELRRAVSMAARRVRHAVDLTARAARAAVPERRVISFVRRERRPVFTPMAHGLIVHGDEVGLDKDTDRADPVLGLHAGALAAERGLVLSPVTVDNLAKYAPPIERPWPAEVREAFVTMLSTGEHLIGVWESLDLGGLITRWLPEWKLVSVRPQHNPIHRYTVDRHLVQTAAEARRHLTQVERPDLLLVAALFHDLGKGLGGGVDHGAVGAPLAGELTLALGFDSDDADLVARLVHHHLLLAELATRRDHSDPATLDALVAAVDGRAEVLNLLRRLTESDARAAGPAAWSPWRAQLINSLADHAEGLLVGEVPRGAPADMVDIGLARSVRLDGTPRVRIEPKPGGVQIVIAARDRLGLFSETAGMLASHSVAVRSAALHTVKGVAVNTWRVDKQDPSDVPDRAFLVKQLQRLEAGDETVLAAVRRREERARSERTGAPYVELISDASESATVVEVRAGDRAGLLYALGAAITGCGLSIRSAHVNTLAGQAIDTFYLTAPDGARPSATQTDAAVAALVGAALSSA